MNELIAFEFRSKNYSGTLFNGDLEISLDGKNYILNDKNNRIYFISKDTNSADVNDFKIIIQNRNSILIEPKKCSIDFFSYDTKDSIAWTKKHYADKRLEKKLRQYLVENRIAGKKLDVFNEPFCPTYILDPTKSVIVKRWHEPAREYSGFYDFLMFEYSNIHNCLTHWDMDIFDVYPYVEPK